MIRTAGTKIYPHRARRFGTCLLQLQTVSRKLKNECVFWALSGCPQTQTQVPQPLGQLLSRLRKVRLGIYQWYLC
jgi:hypothetical protein